jgi:hypothetical protein
MADSKTIDLLDEGSLFLYIAKPDDIEHERQQMEYRHRLPLGIHTVEAVTRSGTRCTRVTWEVLL